MASAPSAQASPFGFERTYYPIVGGGYRTIETGAITEGGPVISGSHKVSVQLVSQGEIDQMLVRGDAEETIIAGADSIQLFAAYDFSASNGILSVDVQTDLADFGTAELVFTVETGTNTVGIANIDTRLQGEENIDGGHRYAKDPVGGLLDLAPSTGGVTITKNRMTGLIWSEYFGWIDLQPPGGGLTVEIESEDRANISGLAYNGEVAGRQGWLGWIDFGPIDGVGGVYIDGDGFFHGTALTQNWGYISFGDYMAIQPGTQFDPPQTRTINKNNSWAKTTWSFVDNNAPVITLVSPVDDTDLTDANKREPTFTFHITEEDNEEVGYLLALERENAPDSWSAYRSYELPYDADDDGTPDLLAPNAFGENYDYQFPTPINPGKYRWRMRAFDKYSAWSDYTEYWHFTVENAVPQTTLIYPANCPTGLPDSCENLGTRRPTFRFTITEADGDNLQYVVEISTDPNFPRNKILAQSSPLSPYALAKGAGNEYTYTPAVNLPATDPPLKELYWQVVATDIYGGVQSPIPYNHFRIKNQPPTLESAFLQDNNNNTIPDGATTYDTAPTLVWTSADEDTGATGILTAGIRLTDLNGPPSGYPAGIFPISVAHQKGRYQWTTPTLNPSDYSIEIRICDEDNECSASRTLFFSIESRDQFGNVGTVVIQSMKNDNGVGRMVGADGDSTNNKYAWNPTNGWIDLNPVSGGVIVENNRVLGYAWNDALGWIRMNCIAPDADTGIVSGGGQIADNCGGAAWGVTNEKDLVGDFSNLKGKALIEATGDFLYFDEASYVADFPADSGNSEISNINVDISCDNTPQLDGSDGHVTLGHFLGSAWSPAMGWVAFGRADLQTMGMTETDAADNFAITEWSCGDNPEPILLEENKYIVFDARDDDYSYPIAESSNSAFAADLVCDDNLDVNSTQIKVDKLLPDGSLDIALANQQDFEIGCKDSTKVDSVVDGKLWLTIKKDSPLYYTQKPGLYRVSGTVANEQGYKTEFPKYSVVSPHPFVDEFIFQIVSAEPDMGNEKTIVPATIPDTLVADGVDSVTFDIRLFDTFDNPVHKTYKYEDTSEAVLKEVSYRAVFLDDVKLDQVNEPGSGVREAVTFGGNVDTGAPSVDSKSGGLYTVQYFVPDVEDSSDNILAGVQSIAPTNEDNILKLDRIEAVVRQVYEATQQRHPVGQTDDQPSQTKVKPLNKNITFAPLVTADVSNFGSFGTVDSDESRQPIILTNNSTTVDVEDYDWLTLVKTEINSGSNGGSYYEDVQLRDDPAGGGVSSLPKKYYVENSSQSLNSPNIFRVGKGTQFAGLIRSELVNFVSADQPLLINQRMLNPIPAKENNLNQDNFKTMYLAATLRRDSFYEDQEEYPRLVQAIAVKIGTKTAIFALDSPLSPNPLTYLVMAISGLVHAKEINENNLVGKNAGTDEFSMIGRVYNRPEVRRIMYENYAKITAGKSSSVVDINDDGVNQTVSFDNGNSFISIPQSGTAWLQDGKVRWIERQNQSNPTSVLSVNIGSNDPLNSIDIPAGSGPITLLVRGGNVYIRNNITVGKGGTLGIIVLRSEKNSQKGTEGNIFIDPSVTHIEAAMYADGSVMSAKDGNDGMAPNDIIEEPEIYDGFSTNLDEISNQLLIRGSVVSQNIIGTSGEAEVPSEDVWLPLECSTSFSSCDQDWRQKSAKRYDFSFLRRYRLVSEINDVDLDGIDDAVDCHVIDGDGADITTNTINNCSSIADSYPQENYNINCQYDNGDVMAENYPSRSSDCSPTVTDRIAKDNGHCAFGTPWCPPVYQPPFTISCGTGPTYPCDSTTGKFLNRKVGASVLIEYDNRIKDITPVGMDIPAIVDFNRQ